MTIRSRIQWMGLISPLLILCISLIRPNECKSDSLPVRTNDTVSYPGGETALQDFLFNHNVFNSSKAEYSIEGIVVLRLSIGSDGHVKDKNILRGIGGEIDEEALRLADLLSFNPATNSRGKAINSEYILKVYFYPRKEKEILIYSIHDTITIEVLNDEFEKLYFRNGPAGFPGGSRKMKRYFKENMVYQTTIYERNNGGEVELMLWIDSYGNLTFLQVVKSSDPRLNAEAIRLVKSVKRWKPEIRNNKPNNYSSLIVDVKF